MRPSQAARSGRIHKVVDALHFGIALGSRERIWARSSGQALIGFTSMSMEEQSEILEYGGINGYR